MVNEFRALFPDLKVEWCKEGKNERGTKLTGAAVIPFLSEGNPLTRIELSKKYRGKLNELYS